MALLSSSAVERSRRIFFSLDTALDHFIMPNMLGENSNHQPACGNRHQENKNLNKIEKRNHHAHAENANCIAQQTLAACPVSQIPHKARINESVHVEYVSTLHNLIRFIPSIITKLHFLSPTFNIYVGLYLVPIVNQRKPSERKLYI